MELKQEITERNLTITDPFPRQETLYGVPAQETRVGENVFLYTYSGAGLEGNKLAQGMNISLINVPFWKNAEAVIVYKPSPAHRWQDASAVLVDIEKKWIVWAKADGVSVVRDELGRPTEDNQSGGVAQKLVEDLVKTSWRNKDWLRSSQIVFQEIGDKIRQRKILGAASVQYGKAGKFRVGNEWNYEVETIQVGSDRNRKYGQFVLGDAGSIEVFHSSADIKDYREFVKELDFERNFVGYHRLPPRLPKHSSHFSAGEDVWIVSYTDGVKPLLNGVWASPGVRIKEVVKNGISKQTVGEALKMLKKQEMLSQIDDITILLFRLPK